MLCHAAPSVWRGHGLTVEGADGARVTIPNHVIEAHIDPRARLAQLQARPRRPYDNLSYPEETEENRAFPEFWLALASAHGALWDVERILLAGAWVVPAKGVTPCACASAARIISSYGLTWD